MKRLLLSATAAAVLVAAPLPAHAAAVSDSPVTGTGFNGAVHAVTHHGATVYSGGDFTYALEDGTRHERTHLAATTTVGALTSFAPRLDGPVEALTTDAEYLYIAGRFSRVEGVAMQRIARFRLSDGELDENFTVKVNALPRALAVADGRLYIGGVFTEVNGRSRTKLAAVSVVDGELDEEFTPTLDRGVRAVTSSGGRLYIGGGFTEVNGTAMRKLAALEPDTGELVESFSPVTNGVIYAIAVSGDRVYAAAGGPGGRVHAFDSTGAEAWQRPTDGDVTAVTVHDGVVYAGGHFEKICAGRDVGDSGACIEGVFADRRKLFAVTTENSMLAWNPDADSVLGVLDLDAGDRTVIAGGTFLTFGGGQTQQRALALFRSLPVAPRGEASRRARLLSGGCSSGGRRAYSGNHE